MTMRVLTSVSTIPADVRRAQLFRHRVAMIPNTRVFLMANALGLPRLWHMAIGHSLTAFVEGMDAKPNAPITQRLDTAMQNTRIVLGRAGQTLVERVMPDVALLALAIEDDSVHVASVGATRAYIYRGGTPRRLTPRQDDAGGVLVETPVRAHMKLEPSDIILAGSVSAFSSHAVSRITQILTADRDASPSTLANVLTEPAAKSGVGAGAIVVRL